VGRRQAFEIAGGGLLNNGLSLVASQSSRCPVEATNASFLKEEKQTTVGPRAALRRDLDARTRGELLGRAELPTLKAKQKWFCEKGEKDTNYGQEFTLPWVLAGTVASTMPARQAWIMNGAIRMGKLPNYTGKTSEQKNQLHKSLKVLPGRGTFF